MEHPIGQDPRQQLVAMLAHAARHSLYYCDQEWAARLRAGHDFAFRDIPITPSAVVKSETRRFHSTFVPPEDGVSILILWIESCRPNDTDKPIYVPDWSK